MERALRRWCWSSAEIDVRIERLRGRIEDGSLRVAPIERAVIATPDDPQRLVGMVSWHWEAEESDWRRIGAIVFDPAVRGRGIGTEALRIWTDYLFANTDVVRLDFSTWSGNTRMLGVGHRLGFVEEARFREAREVRGERYDSGLGVLRREWLAQPDVTTLALTGAVAAGAAAAGQVLAPLPRRSRCGRPRRPSSRSRSSAGRWGSRAGSPGAR